MSFDLFPEELVGNGGQPSPNLLDSDPHTLVNSLLRGASASARQIGAYDRVRKSDRAYPPDRRDLLRLHCLVRSRRVTTVLEFGVGYSTMVLADALKRNHSDYASSVSANLRRSDAWKLFSVDDSEDWVQVANQRLPLELLPYANLSVSKVQMTTFQGRICTEYVMIPNVCPDLIYLDAPSQDLAEGEVNGISTRHLDRVPMACDVLKIEYFLLPGTLIVIDGRTANARFLVANLQRNWWHHHDVERDVHYLELRERPVGRWNAAQLSFCLGDGWLSMVDQ